MKINLRVIKMIGDWIVKILIFCNQKAIDTNVKKGIYTTKLKGVESFFCKSWIVEINQIFLLMRNLFLSNGQLRSLQEI